MGSQPVLALQEWEQFVLPHSLRLLGEYQHLIGAGAVVAATNLRLRVTAEATGGPPAIELGRWADTDTGWSPFEGDSIAARVVCWERALQVAVDGEPGALHGLAVRLDFGPLAGLVPADVLAASPAVALALAVAGTGFRGEGDRATAEDLARLACRIKALADPPGTSHADRFHAEMLQSILGGVAFVSSEGDRLNVQPLLPPDSLLLGVVPDPQAPPVAPEPLARVAEALARVRGRNGRLAGGDEGMAELFRIGRDELTDEQTGLLYGLMRVREMADGFLEGLGDEVVDNDRLAEICDEESAILTDYLGLAPGPYAAVRAAASEAGALGLRLTWAFGGCLAALIIAPGRREQVGEALARRFPRASFLVINVEPEGLRPAPEEDDWDPGP
ncbi:MAG: hypothetical protein GXY85_10915 [Candidatus Brocadiaceae bacterium]|nr:hypothetical protein [Candidatus Brocadiaceae bacterium]